MRNFRTLNVYQQAIAFANKIYQTTDSFPVKEKYGLCSQMQRAAVSIPSNIAEGSSRRTSADFARFLDAAIGSAFELETQLTIAHNIGYLDIETYQTLIEGLTSIQKQTNQLRKKILE